MPLRMEQLQPMNALLRMMNFNLQCLVHEVEILVLMELGIDPVEIKIDRSR